MVNLWIWLAIAVLWKACKVLTGSYPASLFFFFLSHTRCMCTIFTFKKNIYINCSTFFVPDCCGKFSSPYLGKAQQPQEQRHHFYRCWCRNVVPAHAHRCWCMQLHMGDVRTPCVREPALGEKSPASLGLKPVSVLRLAFLVRCSASWAVVLACLNVKTNLQFQFILLFLFSELTDVVFYFLVNFHRQVRVMVVNSI